MLVFHSSRFARNTLEAKRYKKLLRSELGIDVISVTQPLGGDADDPASFLAESVHEIFDEYYSVSLSFWTKMGLKEKARQGLLTGSLPWGYRKGARTGRRAGSGTGTVRDTAVRAATPPGARPTARSRSG